MVNKIHWDWFNLTTPFQTFERVRRRTITFPYSVVLGDQNVWNKNQFAKIHQITLPNPVRPPWTGVFPGLSTKLESALKKNGLESVSTHKIRQGRERVFLTKHGCGIFEEMALRQKKHCRYLWHSSFTQNTLRRHIFCRVVLNIPFSFVSQFIIQYLFNTVWNPKIPSKLFNRHLLLKNPLFWISLFRNPLFVVNFLFWEILSLL